MKLIKLVVLFFLLFSNISFASDIENLFKQNLSVDIIVRAVPFGFIVSIDESEFFNFGSAKLTCKGISILNKIAAILDKIEEECVVEGHNDYVNSNETIYNNVFEISHTRAYNIANYLMRCKNISPEKLSVVGFGDIMPMQDNNINLNNRINFVILDYTIKN